MPRLFASSRHQQSTVIRELFKGSNMNMCVLLVSTSRGGCLAAPGDHEGTLPFPMKMASFTRLWYIRASAGRYVFRWNRLLDEGLAFVQAGVPSFPDDVTLRSCTREFQMWCRSCKQIDPHWVQGRQIRFGECYQPCRENSSWYIRSDYVVQQIFNQSHPASYFQQLIGSCYSLWITGNSLWHRDLPWHAVDRCQLYFQGKHIFYVLINIFFKLKIFYFNFHNLFICTTCKHFTL